MLLPRQLFGKPIPLLLHARRTVRSRRHERGSYSSLASSYAVGFDFFGIPLGVGATAGILSGTVALFLVVNILRGAAAERLYDR